MVARTRTTFDPAKLAKQIIAISVVPKQRKLTASLSRLVERDATTVTEGFFPALAALIPADKEPFSGLGGTLGGTANWKPLSYKYARSKGSDQFFAYTSLRNGLLKRLRKNRTAMDFRRGQGSRLLRGKPLKSWLEERKGVALLGPPQVTVGVTTQRVLPFDPRRGNPEITPRTIGSGNTAEEVGGLGEIAKRIPVRVKLFPKLSSFPPARVEQVLFAQPSGQKQVAKLVGKRKWHRPLMRPFLAYTQEIVFRRLLASTLARLKVSASIASAGRVANQIKVNRS